MTGPYDDLPEGPEGSGRVPDPEEKTEATQAATFEDGVLRHVLDAVRGGETPDVVPAASSVAGFAEFLAVEAVLDKRWPETTMEPSLDRIRDLVELLGDPQRGYPLVHLTGTNGKTSTSRMIDALLSEIGLRTGRYTSPHLSLIHISEPTSSGTGRPASSAAPASSIARVTSGALVSSTNRTR